MKNKFLFILLLFFCSSKVFAVENIPYLKNNGGAVQLMVDNKPYMMIAGELHNSSTSTIDYMKSIWDKMVKGNLNTVLAAVSWQQFEPVEGTFDYSLVDAMIKEAEQRNLKLVLLWFGTWKNGESSYTPDWVKKNIKRFFRVKDKEGKDIETISPFCEEIRKADCKAFKSLMSYLAKNDTNHTVIMIQPENEMGIFQDIDYSKAALKAFNEEVPTKLIEYIKNNERKLEKQLLTSWIDNGRKNEGNWVEVFGDNPYTKEFFMASQYASYVNDVAGSGKEVYSLPMFVNAWIIQTPNQLPGQYPNGGPVSRVLDIYKALANNIDVLCPDIYLPDFKNEVAKYIRYDNPLLIPESKYEPGRAFYAFAECDALCFAIFGIEDYTDNMLLQETYKILGDLHDIILKNQGNGKMKGFLKYNNKSEKIVFGDYVFSVEYKNNDEPAFGMIIQTENDKFIISGMNFDIKLSSLKENKTAYFLQIWEGDYNKGEWEPLRLLNGDETLHNSRFMAPGRWKDGNRLPQTYNISVYTRN